MRRAAKVDANQPAIVRGFRARGATVQHLHALGQGVPDLLVGYRGVTGLAEVKTSKGVLTEAEAEWHDAWRGGVFIVRDDDDVLAMLGVLASMGEARRRSVLDRVRALGELPTSVLASSEAPERARTVVDEVVLGVNPKMRIRTTEAPERGGKP